MIVWNKHDDSFYSTAGWIIIKQD